MIRAFYVKHCTTLHYLWRAEYVSMPLSVFACLCVSVLGLVILVEQAQINGMSGQVTFSAVVVCSSKQALKICIIYAVKSCSE